MAILGTRQDCIRCADAPAVDDLGYCGHCHWVVRVEVEEGIDELRRYLEAWSLYAEWCEERGIRP
ncbi:MAG TPA: hypothetical protein VFA56_05600 [Gaiellaceae bacterium]|nr:hypothetical protein [Gaiellaceae bacterium]